MDATATGGDSIAQDLLTYPLANERWGPLMAFWQTEWDHTDLDWPDSLRGAYAETLTIRLALATLRGEIVGTASAIYPRTQPEACCISGVLTRRDMRGRGIAARLTEAAVQSAFAAGCRTAYLGNRVRATRSVYEKIGFHRIRGAIMRRSAQAGASPETEWYARGQRHTVRETVWADLPGVACLLAQPLGTCFADYPRGLMSIAGVDPTRCVSAFTTVWYEVKGRGGKMFTLVGDSPHRVLGFASLTPEPGAARAHRAVVEFVTHDSHDRGAGPLIRRLLAEARARRLRAVQAYAAESDQAKMGHLRRAGFRTVGRLPSQVLLGGKLLGVSLLSASVGAPV